MEPPNYNVESEDESEVSSQVASNVSIQETSSDPSKDSTTTSSCLTNLIKLQPDQGSSAHRHWVATRMHIREKGHWQNGPCGWECSPDTRGGARFEQGYYGLPVFIEDEEAELFWPGSFRQIGERVGGSAIPELAQGPNINFVPMAPPPTTDSSSPDLTLKL
ncbi:unnamed protein product, partial [Vitis vinifera]